MRFVAFVVLYYAISLWISVNTAVEEGISRALIHQPHALCMVPKNLLCSKNDGEIQLI